MTSDGFKGSNFYFENGSKMNLRTLSKNYAADQEKEFSTKSILQPLELTSPFRQRESKAIMATEAKVDKIKK